jgi:uncharacterized protein (TIGR02466 family)
MIQILFPIPIGIYERPETSSIEEIDFVKSLHYVNNVYNLIGAGKQILNAPELANIKQFVEKSISEYVEEAYKVTTKFRISLSWSNLTEPNQSHHEHSHQNSIFSGTYYFEDIKDSPIMFGNPHLNRDMVIHNEDGYLDWNEFNSQTWSMNHIKAHSCVLFPSWLKHAVGSNISDTNRYSIAFNTFFAEGESIGIEGSATHLKL